MRGAGGAPGGDAAGGAEAAAPAASCCRPAASEGEQRPQVARQKPPSSIQPSPHLPQACQAGEREFGSVGASNAHVDGRLTASDAHVDGRLLTAGAVSAEACPQLPLALKLTPVSPTFPATCTHLLLGAAVSIGRGHIRAGLALRLLHLRHCLSSGRCQRGGGGGHWRGGCGCCRWRLQGYVQVGLQGGLHGWPGRQRHARCRGHCGLLMHGSLWCGWGHGGGCSCGWRLRGWG